MKWGVDAPGGIKPLVHHERPVHEIVLFWESDLDDGLSEDEAAARLDRFGANALPPRSRHGPVVRLLLQFHNPLVYVLLTAMVVTLSIGGVLDALVIAGVVMVNAIVGFVQEWRAGEALEALAAATRTQASVIRSGKLRRIDSLDVVPGDVVVIEAGDKVPADIRLTLTHELQVDESPLTGESVPVGKACGTLAADSVLGDRSNMAYSGTYVTSGTGQGLVVATGIETEIGRIHQLVGKAEGVSTPLTKRLAVFSRWLTIVILGLASLTLLVGIVRGESIGDMVTAAVALAVGAIPEGLPAAVTITLAIGVSRMARRHAIIRRLPAAETLGSTTAICTYKTGTLTQNRMTVQYVFAHGRVHPIDDANPDHVLPCLTAGMLCNNADVEWDEAGRLTSVGDPTEVALLLAASRMGLATDADQAGCPRIDELPFSSELRLMATLHESPDAETDLLVVKGASEAVLDLCGSQRTVEGGLEPLDRPLIESQVTAFGEEALRVLAFATARVPHGWVFGTGALADHSMTFLGLQAMADPPRQEAIRAIASCHSAGIAVKMITGDHARTARAVAARMGLLGDAESGPVVMTGIELAQSAPEDLARRIESVDVFARVSPEQKLGIVRSLQRSGQIVAMTGDGINDAPALKQADIGIAMGHGGTEVAKEASDMVLTDDNFASVEAAVEEGRGVFDNLTKFITWTLPTNLGEGFVVLAAVATGVALPILPVQILWINMTTAVALVLMLAFEPAEKDIMQRPPRPPAQPILTGVLVRRILLVGAFMLVGAFGLFQWALNQGATLNEARTIAVNAFVAMEVGYLLNCRALDRSLFSVGIWTNRPLLVGVACTIALQWAFTYLPFMNEAFQSAPLPWSDWVVVALLGSAIYAAVGTEKWISARMSRSRRTAMSNAGGRVPRGG